MQIGELAERAGVSAKTIRYYEDVGILEPARRFPNGYRDYDAVAVNKLRFIKTSQAIGLRLGEVKQILALRDRGVTPCAHVAELIEARSAAIEDQIAELESMRKELDRLRRRARRLEPKNCRPKDICHIIHR